MSVSFQHGLWQVTATNGGSAYGFANASGNMTTNFSGGNLYVTGTNVYGFINIGNTLTNTITGATLFFDEGTVVALGTTLDFQGGTFSAGVGGAYFGGTDSNSLRTNGGSLTLSSRATYQAAIATTMTPVIMTTPIQAGLYSVATLGEATLNVVSTQTSSELANQTFLILKTDTGNGSSIHGSFGSLISSNYINYTVHYNYMDPDFNPDTTPYEVTITVADTQNWSDDVGPNATANAVRMA